MSVGLVVPALGQEAFTFAWQVQDIAGTGPTNSDGVIDPGEDAWIYLYASFRPGVGGTAIWDTLGGTGQTGAVSGLAFAGIDLLGTANLNTGAWVNVGIGPGFDLGSTGVIQPNNDLTNVTFGQFILPGQLPYTRNDDWFFRARWRPSDYSSRRVDFRLQINPLWTNSPAVLLDTGDRDPQGFPIYHPDTWSTNNPVGHFDVIPCPSGFTVLATSSLAFRRRRGGDWTQS